MLVNCNEIIFDIILFTSSILPILLTVINFSKDYTVMWSGAVYINLTERYTNILNKLYTTADTWRMSISKKDKEEFKSIQIVDI